jgi:putative DNA primase/helicase
VTAETLTKALGGKWYGSYGSARCPAHNDKNPSLSISELDGKVLVYCHAGCDQRDVVAALKGRGLWGEQNHRSVVKMSSRTPLKHQPSDDDVQRGKAAMTIWESAQPAQDTLVAVYLASRGICLPVPDTLRFHPSLKHPSAGSWPAMIALVASGSDGEPLAVHRTYIARDGSDKAPVQPTKMMLGPCHGGAVRLADPTELLMVGEGIETALAAMQATGHPAWAALSTSGLKSLDLPSTVRKLIVLADGDDAGEAAARQCAGRWVREGRQVRIARPPRGSDFNDLLLNPEIGLEAVGS